LSPFAPHLPAFFSLICSMCRMSSFLLAVGVMTPCVPARFYWSRTFFLLICRVVSRSAVPPSLSIITSGFPHFFSLPPFNLPPLFPFTPPSRFCFCCLFFPLGGGALFGFFTPCADQISSSFLLILCCCFIAPPFVPCSQGPRRDFFYSGNRNFLLR